MANFDLEAPRRLPFDGVFVINLPNDKLRRAKIRRMLQNHQIPFEFVPGERGRHADPKRAGILGCLWTHTKCVRAAKDMGWSSVLIAEDDAVLHPRFYELLPDLALLQNIEWDIFYFYHLRDGFNYEPPLSLPVQIIPIDYSLGTHFYAVHSRFYNEYLKTAVTSNSYSDRLFRGRPYRLFGLSSNLVGQDGGKSSIDGQNYIRIRCLSF